MDILDILNLWTPFTIYVATTTTTPAHWHDLVGPGEQLYVLTGASAELYETVGPSEQLYILEGCR
jgi:hypothetical protein